MTKLSLITKEDELLGKLFLCFPSAWPKLRRTSRLFSWRLEDKKLQKLNKSFYQELMPQLDLHYLCAKGDVDNIWRCLTHPEIDCAKILKQRDQECATMLQKAVQSQKLAVVKFLVEKGHSVNPKGAYGYTPLHEACYVGQPDVVRLLLQGNANVDALSKNGSTSLLVASREGHQQVVEALLLYGADGDDGGDKGWTPLSVAAGEGHVEVCQTLLKYKANVNGFVTDGRFERSSLQEAAEQGHVAVVQLLVERAADVNHTFADSQSERVTAYDLAKNNGHEKVAELLARAHS
eukprot:TRINITY_DN82203_c0_g1_i1.p1 TRINITY_DN82203_c0_g1~~TRINITY_DN82203_c0_g1_i1.p1  ORF type:complete len:292 (+),score=72.86 TRINITY_DN82203_c0_g1_i1:78-953(+)